MIKVIPGIYQLQIPIPETSLEYINVYLVQGDNGYLLVDTGWNTSEAFDSLKKQLSEIGVDFKDISQIAVTHIHPDHYGLVGKLKQLSQAKFALHYLEKDLIESRYINMEGLLQQTAQWLHINGVPPDELTNLQTASVGMASFVVPTPPDITLHGGEIISTGVFSFQVLWTPGHAPGHICLYEPTRKILFAGDHILPTITPNIGLHPQSSPNPLGDYLNSLNQIKQLDVNLILPGHENPFSSLERRIEEIVQHHERRNAEILKTIETTPKTAYQIATDLTWMSAIKGVGWHSLDSWNKRLAVLETIAHLEAIRFAKKINKFYRDDIIYYRLDTAK